MYKEYFGFNDTPFSIAPDPHYLYLSEQHNDALAHLLYGIGDHGGFVLLTGEVGTGKTTICRCLLQQLPEDCDIAYIVNPRQSVTELLKSICDELSIYYSHEEQGITYLVDVINEFLLDKHSQNRNVVLIIDEAQNLSADVLEQLRLLTNLETDNKKLLQLILLGQPELNTMLDRQELRQLAQRITARFHLRALTLEETSHYIYHRLGVAGYRGELFPVAAIKRIHRFSKGIPRLVNVLCDRCLLGVYSSNGRSVEPHIVSDAIRQVRGQAGVSHWSGKIRRLLGAAGLLAAIGVGLWFVRDLWPTGSADQVDATAVAENTQADPLLRLQQQKDELLADLLTRHTSDLQESNCDEARGAGLQCVDAKDSLASWLELGVPALIKLSDPEDSDLANEWVLALAPKSAANDITPAVAPVVQADGSEKLIDINAIAERWSGEYTWIWEPVTDFREQLSLGEQGRFVRYLKALLTHADKSKVTTATDEEWPLNRFSYLVARHATVVQNDVVDIAFIRQLATQKKAMGIVQAGIPPALIQRLGKAMESRAMAGDRGPDSEGHGNNKLNSLNSSYNNSYNDPYNESYKYKLINHLPQKG